MGWVITLLAAILFAIVAGFLFISWMIDETGLDIRKRLQRLEQDVTEGRSHLAVVADDVRDRREKERVAERAELDRYR